MGEKGNQGETRGKADTPSNKGKQKGTQGETRPREGGDTIQKQRQKIGDKGGKTSGRRTHHPTHAHMWGDKGDKTSGRRTHHPTQAHICGETMGDKGSQGDRLPGNFLIFF